MNRVLDVRHRTTYCYARPVSFGEHRMMLRPRDSHDLRVLSTSLVIEPAATTRWVHDVFGNSITLATFRAPATELTIESRFRIAHYPNDARAIIVDPAGATYPFAYAPDDLRDLRTCIEMHGVDTHDSVGRWARGFLGGSFARGTMDLLVDINETIRRDFRYVRRDDAGTQAAADTLLWRSGSCRDFAMLFIDAVRHLGIAARFVSGYCYDDAPGAASDALVGGGATHAWLEVFLPGAGWVEFDPTHGGVGSRHLIRVAVARSPSQAVPVAGNYEGRAADFLGLFVTVAVSRAPGP